MAAGCGILGGGSTPGGGDGNVGGDNSINISVRLSAITDKHTWSVKQIGLSTAALDTTGHGGVTETGTKTLLQDKSGAYVSYASATTSLALAGWRSTSNVLALALLPSVTFVIKSGTVITEVAYDVNFATITGASSADRPTRITCCRYNNDVAVGNTRTDTNWFAYSAEDTAGPAADDAGTAAALAP